MNKDLIEEFRSKSNEYLLDICNNKRNEYREDALLVIEQVLTERKVEFNRPVTSSTVEIKITKISKRIKVDKKVYRKVFIWLIVISIMPMLAHIAYREGKLFTDDTLFMFFHKIYKVVGFPLVFLEPASDNHLISILVLLINIFLISYLIAYLICKWKEV